MRNSFILYRGTYIRMVTQTMLRTYDAKLIFFKEKNRLVTDLDLIKRFKHIK